MNLLAEISREIVQLQEAGFEPKVICMNFSAYEKLHAELAHSIYRIGTGFMDIDPSKPMRVYGLDVIPHEQQDTNQPYFYIGVKQCID